MEKLRTFLGFSILILITISIAAVFTGTIVWILWPSTIPVILGTLVPAKITWWTSVKLCWICALLFKSTIKTN
jgi:hypothetical protein